MTEKKFVEVEDEESVAVVHHEADSDKWIFFCHGFGSDKEGSYEKRSERAVEEGFNAVRFDFRGNNESEGDFMSQTLSSKLKDLQAVVDYFGPEEYVVFGMSFGGRVALHQAVEDERVAAFIGKSPVTYNEIMSKFKSVVEEKGEFTLFGDKTIDHRFVEDLEQRDFRSIIGDIQVPALFFHGRDDTTVHPEFTWKAAEKLDKDTRVEMFEGEKHSMSDRAEEKLLDSMFSWLENL